MGEPSALFIVEAGVHYEGSSPVRAFIDKHDAEKFAEELRAYQETSPEWPAGESAEEIEQWRIAKHAWDAGHPGGDVGSSDYFIVIEVPFGAAQEKQGEQS